VVIGIASLTLRGWRLLSLAVAVVVRSCASADRSYTRVGLHVGTYGSFRWARDLARISRIFPARQRGGSSRHNCSASRRWRNWYPAVLAWSRVRRLGSPLGVCACPRSATQLSNAQERAQPVWSIHPRLACAPGDAGPWRPLPKSSLGFEASEDTPITKSLKRALLDICFHAGYVLSSSTQCPSLDQF